MKAQSLQFKRFGPRGNKRGIAIIYLALLLVVLLAFAGLAIDIGYMYLAKTQLQNAADAAAHAGASKLQDQGGILMNLADARINIAKNEAVSFALNNKAAGQSIVILSDGTNVLSSANDVTVGFWNGSTYTPNITPVNALQARPRRTQDSPGGKIAIFFGKVIGISEMPASASAVAALPVRAGIYVAFCADTCTGCTSTFCNYSTAGQQYDTGPGLPYSGKFAWTTLVDNPTAASNLSQMMCSERPWQNVCNKSVYTTMGTVASTARDMATYFYNTNYDVGNKTFTMVNGQKVTTGWEVIVPVTSTCPPGSQGSWEPALITHYAKVTITAICATGNYGCFGAVPNLTTACGTGQLPRRNCCANFANNSIVVSRIQCVPCSNQNVFSGTRPVIVR